MGWNISNILVNEAIANKKAGGGDMESRVEALETTVGDSSSGLVKDVSDLETTVGDSSSGLVKDVSDLTTAIEGLYPDVYSTEETLIGKWGNEDIYRKCLFGVSLPNNTSQNYDFGLSNVKVRRIYGTVYTTGYSMPLPFVAASSADSIEMYYTEGGGATVITHHDRSNQTADLIIEYTKNATNDTRKRGK